MTHFGGPSLAALAEQHARKDAQNDARMCRRLGIPWRDTMASTLDLSLAPEDIAQIGNASWEIEPYERAYRAAYLPRLREALL